MVLQSKEKMSDPAFRSATALAAALRRKEIGAEELLDHYLARIGRHNAALNAVVALDPDAARQAARAADAALARGETLGPLHGLPMTIKECFEAVGMPASCGLPGLAKHMPDSDADSVARLKAAGAVIFGKTNLPAGASDHQTYNTLYGTTNNPWDLGRTPGGSSGGSAAAIAAGLAALEMGSDIGGSIRVPAHLCGVYGHKPSYGIVSGRGHIPPPPGSLYPTEIGVFGPLARSAYDLELALEAMAGPEPHLAKAWSLSLPPARHAELRRFRVAMWADASAYTTDSGYLAAIHQFADDLRRLGVTVDLARPEIDPLRCYEDYLATVMGIFGARVPEEELAAQLDSARHVTDPDSYPARVARAATQSYRDWIALGERRERIGLAWRAFFRQFDLLLCPAFATVAFPHDNEGNGGHNDQFSRVIMVDGRPRPYLDNLMWPGFVTIANLPSTVVPTGRLVNGLPAGIQIVGPFLEDRTPLRFAQLVEDAIGGYRIPPSFAD